MNEKVRLPEGIAVIVCEHVACGREPILSGFRTAPDFPEDSGWQFFCGKVEEEDPNTARMWAVEEVLKMAPSLRKYIELQPEVQVYRRSVDDEWKVRQL